MLEPVAKKTLSEEVISKLRRYILANSLEPGHRLPAESQLAIELGVSRSTVRDAMKSLETVGAVVRRPKIGAVLQEIDLRRTAELSRFMMLRSAEDIRDMFIARRVLELGAIPYVVHNATDEDYDRLEKTIQLREAQIQAGGTGVEGDIAFHEALLAAAKNKILAQFGMILQEFLQEVHASMPYDTERHRQGLEDHREILRMLRAGDTKAAEAALKRHMDTDVVQGRVAKEALVEDGQE